MSTADGPRRTNAAARAGRAFVAALALLGPVVALVGSPGGGASLPVSKQVSYAAPTLGFGGYSWFGGVKQISASWRVPEIYKSSKSGSAATWIGAQNRGGQFIQIGTEEILEPLYAPAYDVFWSDPLVQFLPQDIGTVKAGDEVSVSMVQKGYGWTLRVLDKRSSLNVTREIDYGFDDKFTVAEWIQENPSSVVNNLPTIPYPTMGVPTFTDMEVDSSAPDLSLAAGQVLITSSGRYRVPTLVTGDSFTFDAPTATQDRFLTAMAPLDGQSVVFGDALSKWDTLSQGDRSSDVSAFDHALLGTATALTGASWPTAARAVVTRYVTLCHAESRLLRSWSSGFGATSPSANPPWLQSELSRQGVVNQIRSALGLPPVS